MKINCVHHRDDRDLRECSTDTLSIELRRVIAIRTYADLDLAASASVRRVRWR